MCVYPIKWCFTPNVSFCESFFKKGLVPPCSCFEAFSIIQCYLWVVTIKKKKIWFYLKGMTIKHNKKKTAVDEVELKVKERKQI